MPRITSLTTQKRGSSVAIAVEDAPWLTVHREAIFACAVRAGDEATEALAERLREADERHRAHEAALLLLSFRQRSERELRDRLRRKGIRETVTEEVLTRLRGSGLVDDARFASAWVNDRGSGGGARGRALLTAELRAKGISAEAVAEATSGLDDEAQALIAGRSRAARLTGLDYQTFNRRIGGYLQRRGFGAAATNAAVRRLWHDRGGEADANDGHG